jgi:hypothetical protein
MRDFQCRPAGPEEKGATSGMIDGDSRIEAGKQEKSPAETLRTGLFRVCKNLMAAQRKRIIIYLAAASAAS